MKLRMTLRTIEKTFRRLCFAIALLTVGVAPLSAMESADEAIRSTTDTLLEQFEARRDELTSDDAALYALVDEVVLPRFDFERMSRLVLGKHWRKASDDQQQQFVEVFKALLVRTYASALFEYTGQEVEYKPARLTEDDEAEVRSDIDIGNGTKVPLNYTMSKSGDDWLVYDVSIDGISLVTNYRSSYGREIRKNGIDQLIQSLRDKASN